MKIRIELTIDEMSKSHETMNEAANITGLEPADTLFKNQTIDAKSIKISQHMGRFDIDIDSKFTIWILGKVVKIIELFMPFIRFFENIVDNEIEEFISTPVVTHELDDIYNDNDEKVKNVFNV